MKIDYIQRTARKTLAIVVNEKSQVIVKAPKYMSNEEILRFIKSKQKWIDTKVSEIQRQNQIHNDLFQYRKILICGKKYDILHDKCAKDVSLRNGYIVMKPQISAKKEVNRLEKFLKN